MTGLRSGTKMRFRVRAIGGAGPGPGATRPPKWSPEESFNEQRVGVIQPAVRDTTVILKRRTWVLWGLYVLMLLASIFAIAYAFGMQSIVPMGLCDSSPAFCNLPEDD
ncbi:MAG: hypothetical protein ACXWC8_02260, partial [Limisphaerales bacterium]